MKKYFFLSLLLAVCLAGCQSYGNCISGNCINGKGTYTWPPGKTYVGQFKNGMFHGKGIMTAHPGRRYVGEFREGLFEGFGTLTWPIGKKYVGHFKNNDFHGKGAYYIRGLLKRKGIWHRGRFIRAE